MISKVVNLPSPIEFELMEGRTDSANAFRAVAVDNGYIMLYFLKDFSDPNSITRTYYFYFQTLPELLEYLMREDGAKLLNTFFKIIEPCKVPMASSHTCFKLIKSTDLINKTLTLNLYGINSRIETVRIHKDSIKILVKSIVFNAIPYLKIPQHNIIALLN